MSKLSYINFLAKAFGTLILVFVFACSSEKTEDQNKSAAEANIQNVEVVSPAEKNFISEITIAAIIKPDKKVSLYAMESGFVQSVRKDIGDKVYKGELIASLKNPGLFREKERNEATLNGRKATYERLAASHEKTPAITPLQVLEEAKTAYLAAKSQLAMVQEQINLLQIRAPFAGLITKRNVDVGALAQDATSTSSSKALFELQDLSTVRVNVPLPAAEASFVSKNMPVQIEIPDLGGRAFEATVSRVGSAIDPESGVMMAEIDIKNADFQIKPGMHAMANFKLASRENVLSLPVTARHIFQDEAFVLLVDDGKVRLELLRTGLMNKDYFEVLNTGMDENTLIITRGKNLVEEGQEVEAVKKDW